MFTHFEECEFYSPIAFYTRGPAAAFWKSETFQPELSAAKYSSKGRRNFTRLCPLIFTDFVRRSGNGLQFHTPEIRGWPRVISGVFF